MPNHIKNVWKIKNIKPYQMDYIVNKLTTNNQINFDLIIPEPRHKLDCPKEYRVKSAKDAHIAEDDIRPWFNWYDWHRDKWGTKWNAYDGYMNKKHTSIELIFNTAWSFPEPIANRLIKIASQLELNLDIKFADEDFGSNLGWTTYNGKTKILINEIIDNPVEFAQNLWDNY